MKEISGSCQSSDEKDASADTPETGPSGRAGTLLVIVNDSLSALIAKGEVTPRYYNPGDFFRTVHILLTNDDRPDSTGLQRMVGTAELVVHNLPAKRDLFLLSLGWRPRLLRRWADKAVLLARSIRPDLVRCHGVQLNAFLAYRIKQRLGVPYVVSLHANPDADVRDMPTSWQDHLRGIAIADVEKVSLLAADKVLPVYESIVPYLQRLGVKHWEVAYNVINPEHVRVKDDYTLHDPPRVVCVGRQFEFKNPENIIRAVARLGAVHLTLIGDGPYHERLEEAARCYRRAGAFHLHPLASQRCHMRAAEGLRPICSSQ